VLNAVSLNLLLPAGSGRLIESRTVLKEQASFKIPHFSNENLFKNPQYKYKKNLPNCPIS
jgi:hypothetical protein